MGCSEFYLNRSQLGCTKVLLHLALVVSTIGAKPNLYCKAIELVCGGGEEVLAQSKVGGIAAKTSLDQLFVQYKCTVMDKINGHYLQLP